MTNDDWMATHLRCARANYDASHRYDRRAVPRIVHQIWLGSRPVPDHVDRWREFSARHGWTHRLWTETDVLSEGFESEAVFRWFGDGQWGGLQAQSDVARYEILYRYGGLYADCDIVPAHSGTIDVADHLPMTGFAVSTEHAPRDIGTGSLFAANGFMVSCPGHPVLRRVIDSIPINIKGFQDAGIHNTVWMVGPFLLNKCLFGSFHLIHRDWVMVDAPAEHFHLVEFRPY